MIRKSGKPPTALATIGLVAIFSFLIGPTFSGTRERQYVVVISIDGLAPFHLDQDFVNTPNLDFLTNQGVSGTARSVFPSMTWPAHATIVTGVSPGTHGMPGNRYLDRSRRVLQKAWELNREEAIRVPAIYDLARDAGLRTGAFLWPGSAGAKNLDYNIPELYLEEDYKKFIAANFRKELEAEGIEFDLFAKLSEEEKFELDFLARDTATHVIANHRPELILVHFVSLDTYSHRTGPRSRRTRWALQLVDLLVGDLIVATQSAGIYNDTTFFIVSDHGFLEVKHCVDLNRAFAQKGLLSNYANPVHGREAAAAVYNGQTAFVYLQNPGQARVRAAILRSIQAIPEIERVIEPGEFVGLGLATPAENPSMPDLIALSRPDAFFGSNPRRIVEEARVFRGMHGYLPDHPDLAAGFIVSGPRTRHRVEQLSIDLRDFAPTILSVLDIPPPPGMQGRVLTEIFLPPPPQGPEDEPERKGKVP